MTVKTTTPRAFRTVQRPQLFPGHPAFTTDPSDRADAPSWADAWPTDADYTDDDPFAGDAPVIDSIWDTLATSTRLCVGCGVAALALTDAGMCSWCETHPARADVALLCDECGTPTWTAETVCDPCAATLSFERAEGLRELAEVA